MWGRILLAGAAGLGLAAAGAIAGEYCVECTGPDAVYRCTSDNSSVDPDPKLQLICASEMSRLGGHESCSVRRQSAAACDGPLRTVAVPALPIATREGPPPQPSQPAARPAPNVPAVAPTVATPAGQVDSRPAARPATSAQNPAAAPSQPTPPNSAASAAPAAASPAPSPPVTAEPGPPRTVEEAAQGLVKNSSKGLQAAGAAVSETTEKTAGAVGGTAKAAGNMVMEGAKSAGAAVGNAAKKSWNCVATLFSDC